MTTVLAPSAYGVCIATFAHEVPKSKPTTMSVTVPDGVEENCKNSGGSSRLECGACGCWARSFAGVWEAPVRTTCDGLRAGADSGVVVGDGALALKAGFSAASFSAPPRRRLIHCQIPIHSPVI